MLKLGSRVEISGFIGTVLYIGEIDGVAGQFLGIEWDDPTRGKHSGEHNGKAYFKVLVPNSGSFVKYVPEKIDFGRTFLAALIDLYVLEEKNQELFVESVSKHAVKIETVGFHDIQKKQSRIELLEIVQLKGSRISSSGNSGEIKNAAPRLKDVDLSKNLICEWQTVFEICSQLENLERLYLTKNIVVPLFETPVAQNPFKNLRELFLNEMRLTWETAAYLEPLLPSLEELHLRSNDLKSLTQTKIRGFLKLKLLDLENNQLKWDDVAMLSELPSLESLILSGNAISQIFFSKEAGKPFASLKAIFLDRSQIQGWPTIEALDEFPRLEELKLRENPINQVETGIKREVIIGRLAKLKILNSSHIQNQEKLSSERYFLQWVQKSPYLSEIKQTQRYQQLVGVHGEPATAATQTGTLKENLIALDIVFVKENKNLSKKFPVHIQLRKLVTLLQKLVKIDLSTQLIYYLEPATGIKVYLEDEFRELEYYGLENNQTLYFDDTPKTELKNFSIAK